MVNPFKRKARAVRPAGYIIYYPQVRTFGIWNYVTFNARTIRKYRHGNVHALRTLPHYGCAYYTDKGKAMQFLKAYKSGIAMFKACVKNRKKYKDVIYYGDDS